MSARANRREFITLLGGAADRCHLRKMWTMSVSTLATTVKPAPHDSHIPWRWRSFMPFGSRLFRGYDGMGVGFLPSWRGARASPEPIAHASPTRICVDSVRMCWDVSRSSA
jgi:hypothetical protein